MNILINTNGSIPYPSKKKEEHGERNTFGDIFAFSLVSLYTLSALVISLWSAITLMMGNVSSGGPIGILFNKALASGIL